MRKALAALAAPLCLALAAGAGAEPRGGERLFELEAPATPPAGAQSQGFDAQDDAQEAAAPLTDPLVREAHALYFRGEHHKALSLYEKAVRLGSKAAAARLNGAVVLEELGERARAVEWYRAAAGLTAAPEAAAALGWAQWRVGDLAGARASFEKALSRDARAPHALLGAARVALDAARPAEALKLLGQARAAQPLFGVAAYYEGRACEALGDLDHAAEAYRQAVALDSYFVEGRDALGRLAVKRRRYDEAWKQFSRVLASEPRHKRAQSLLESVRGLASKGADAAERAAAQARTDATPALAHSPVGPKVPRLRVGVATNPVGKPRPRRSLAFKASADFTVVEARTGRVLARGRSAELWQVRFKRAKKGRSIVVLDEDGRQAAESAKPILIKPNAPATSAIRLEDVALPNSGGPVIAGKILRGDLEIALFSGGLRLVNVLDLENYTHGVVAAEMPIRSPIEALKAQAIIARSHALFIRDVTRRHRKEGFDVCDEQHCQVYAGARAETSRSREVVDSTRGQIATYGGRVAHVIYSSNCGGHTQSGRDLKGWGDVPYWQGAPDSVDPAPASSPWELRQTLKAWPQAFCQPSNDVHAAHYRWTRVVSFSELDEKISRRLKLGGLKWIRALRRSPGGNVNAIEVRGAKKTVKISDEMQIRGLLGIGSLRSTRFVIEPEYGKNGKPSALVFHGGGWGHSVGLCQSGAMGRAHAGQSAEDMIKAYFKGTALGRIPY